MAGPAQVLERLLLNASGRKLQVLIVATVLRSCDLIPAEHWTLIAVSVAGLVSLEKTGGLRGLLAGARPGGSDRDSTGAPSCSGPPSIAPASSGPCA